MSQEAGGKRPAEELEEAAAEEGPPRPPADAADGEQDDDETVGPQPPKPKKRKVRLQHQLLRLGDVMAVAAVACAAVLQQCCSECPAMTCSRSLFQVTWLELLVVC
jgi:hypothetical protein